MATTSLGRLTVDLMMKTGNFEAGSKQAKKHLKEIDKTVKEVETAVKTSMLAAGAAVAGYAIAIGSMVKKEANAIESQYNLARSMNATVTGIRALNLASADNGLGDMAESAAELNKRMGEAISGTGEAGKVIKALGLDVKKLAASDADERFAMIADAIKESGVSAQQAASYLDKLGIKQQGAYNLFKEGGDAIRANREQVEKLGLAVSGIDAEKIREMQNGFRKWSDEAEGVRTQLSIKLAPIVSATIKLFDEMIASAGGIGPVVQSSVDKALSALTFIMNAVDGFKRTAELAWAVVKAGLTSVEAAALSLGEVLFSAVISPMKGLVSIGAAIKIPGFETAKQTLDEIQTNIGTLASVARDSAVEAANEVSTVFDRITNEQLAGDKFKVYIDQAKKASDEAAKVAAAKNVQAPLVTGLPEATAKNADVKQDPRIQLLLDYGRTREQIIQDQYLKENELIAQQIQDQAIPEADGQAAALAAQRKYADAMKAVDHEQMQAKVSGIQTALSAASTLMNSHNKKMFEIGKAAAIANAIIDTASGVANAWALGPILGPPMAALVALAGAAQIATISSTKIGSATPTTAAAVSNTEAINAATTPVAATQQRVFLQGINPDSLVRAGDVVSVLNEEIKNGARFVFG